MSILVAVSIPFSPGDEFTSITLSPLFEFNMSTPATFKPNCLASFVAIFFSSLVNLILDALPPRCRFDLNSPSVVNRGDAVIHIGVED